MAKNPPKRNDEDSKQQSTSSSGKSITAIYSETSVTITGPLPHPSILKEYELICPGTAKKIIELAIEQSSHRMQSEKLFILSQIRKEYRGQWMAFSLVIGFIIASVIVTTYGYPWVGGIMSGTTIVSIVSIFVIGKNRGVSEMIEKNKLDEKLKGFAKEIQSEKMKT